MRARNIKPDFFLDEDLAILPFEARILFAGLWCCADRAGRLEDRPIRIRAAVFPYDNLDVDALLCKLADMMKIVRYTVDGRKYIQIIGFCKHQAPHHTEKDSIIPEFNGELTVIEPLHNGGAPPRNHSNPPDSLIPDSLIDDSGFTDSPIPTGKPVKARAQAPAAETLYRYAEFYAMYDEEKRALDSKARSWWKRNVKRGDDVRVEQILDSLRAWNATSQFRNGKAWNIGRFLAEGAVDAPPTNKRPEPGELTFLELMQQKKGA